MKRAFVFTGQGEKLQTKEPQLETFCRSIELAKLLIKSDVAPDATAGLSLGEYASLAIAQVFPVEDLKEIIKYRQVIMDEALRDSNTGMVACIGPSVAEIQEAIAGFKLEITNYNSPIQTVVGGDRGDLAKFKDAYSNEHDITIVDMPTIGAFHSSYLRNATEQMKNYLDKYQPKQPKIPIYFNLSGCTKYDDIRTMMADHISHPVLFQKAIENMLKDGIDEFISIGIGTAPVNLIRQTSKANGIQVKIYKMESENDIERILK